MERSSFQTFLRGIILFGFTLLILQLLLTGNINLYISPTMQPFIYFAFVVFLFLSVIQIIRSIKGDVHDHEHDEHCSCEHDHEVKGSIWKKIAIYSVFIFPLITGFVLPDKVLDSAIVDKRGVSLGSGKEVSAPIKEEVYQDEKESHIPLRETYSFDGMDDYYANMAREIIEQDTIIFTDQNYLDMMTVIDLYLYDLMGKQVEVEGFVYRLPGLKLDEFVVARFGMTCCTADTEVYGFLTKGELTRGYRNDDWVRVTGTLSELEFDGWMYPALVDIAIQPIPAPDSPYVFFNFF